jgi:glycosyltransferase involved in cell wall biosynthesis
MKIHMKKISLLVPVLNEEENLPELERRLKALALNLDKYDFEIIILDNCSTDSSPLVIKDIISRSKNWKYVRYSKNFGYHNSLACGYDLASGDALVVVQADLQDPPELIEKMLGLWEEGNDVVYGILLKRNDYSILKTIGAKLFYRIIYFAGNLKMPVNATDFRLVDRKVIDAVKLLREPDRYLRGLVHWVGFRSIGFYYNRDSRLKGISAGNLFYCAKYAVNAFISFSEFPLRFMIYLGVTLITICIFASIYFIWLYFNQDSLIDKLPTGLTMLTLLSIFTIGLNAVFFGVIGEYVGRIYNQGKKRPLYIIDEKINF